MYERNTQTVHPEIRHFYEMPDEVMKRGGKKKKAKKAKTATNINENKINVNVNVGKHDKEAFKKYKAITRTSRFATPNQTFANPPQSQLPSYFAVPNGVGILPNAKADSFQGTALNPPQTIRVDVPAGSSPNPATIPNRQGVEPVSTKSQRAIPTTHATGGVMVSNPLMLTYEPDIEDAEEKEREKEAYSSSIQYFQPTGRNNIPAPVPAQHSAPRADFFPLQGQQPETRELEQKREHEVDLPIRSTHSMMWEEALTSPDANQERMFGSEEISHKIRKMKKGNLPHKGIQSGERYIEFEHPKMGEMVGMKSREYHHLLKEGKGDILPTTPKKYYEILKHQKETPRETPRETSTSSKSYDTPTGDIDNYDAVAHQVVMARGGFRHPIKGLSVVTHHSVF